MDNNEVTKPPKQVLGMLKETWHGIPRSKITWYPIIDYDRCVGCGKCVEYCSPGTFELEEKDGEKRPMSHARKFGSTFRRRV